MSTHQLDAYGLRLLDAAIDEDPIHRQVCELLAGLYPTGPFERRREQRYPLPKLMQLLPVQPDGVTPHGPAVVVAGKHLSETGLSFFHPNPLPYRLVRASLERGDGEWFEFLLDVDWCRFTHAGWYESGGKFVRPR